MTRKRIGVEIGAQVRGHSEVIPGLDPNGTAQAEGRKDL